MRPFLIPAFPSLSSSVTHVNGTHKRHTRESNETFKAFIRYKRKHTDCIQELHAMDSCRYYLKHDHIIHVRVCLVISCRHLPESIWCSNVQLAVVHEKLVLLVTSVNLLFILCVLIKCKLCNSFLCSLPKANILSLNAFQDHSQIARGYKIKTDNRLYLIPHPSLCTGRQVKLLTYRILLMTRQVC